MKNFIVFYYSLNSHFVVLNTPIVVLNLFQDLKMLKQVQHDVGRVSLNTIFVILNSFQDLKKKMLKQVQQDKRGAAPPAVNRRA